MIGKDFFEQATIRSKDFPGSSDSKASAYIMRETQVQSLGGQDFLEKEMATLSSILA